MATATKKSRAVDELLRRVADVRRSASMEFLIVKDTGAAYHWTIVAGDGATLAQSASFASYHDAEKAARRVRDGAASARFDHRAVGAHPADRIALRDPPSDDSDAERRQDRGRQLQQRGGDEMGSATLIAPPQRSPRSEQADRGPAYRCGCGHVLRVFGGGRHRVYFELGDSRLDDPVMNRVCPACGRGLPGKNGSLTPSARAGVPTQTPQARL